MPARSRSGFTLIELLIVVVVIGILATIAIPKFSRMREKSLVAAVTSDLKNLATAQELYLSEQHTYATALTDLTEYRVSDNVLVTINESSGTGWAATGTHSGLAGDQCGIFYGSASAANAVPATSPGSVICN
jgi:prepilin-type N-terminal cleavage/methylation domain-containing protein